MQDFCFAKRSLPQAAMKLLVLLLQIGNLLFETVNTIFCSLADQPLRFSVIGTLPLELCCGE
jgi:hypothetical protein